jgi:hypothetical protein
MLWSSSVAECMPSTLCATLLAVKRHPASVCDNELQLFYADRPAVAVPLPCRPDNTTCELLTPIYTTPLLRTFGSTVVLSQLTCSSLSRETCSQQRRAISPSSEPQRN